MNRELRKQNINGIYQTYDKLAKKNFFKVFNKYKKTNAGDIRSTPSKKSKRKKDNLRKIIEIFIPEEKHNIIIDEKLTKFNLERRPDYYLPNLDLIFEYDGPEHYQKFWRTITDKRKYEEYSKNDLVCIRWPYYLQLTKDVAEFIFGQMIRHYSKKNRKLKKDGYYDEEKWKKAISETYFNMFTGRKAKLECEIPAPGLHSSPNVPSTFCKGGIERLIKDLKWDCKKYECNCGAKAPESLIHQFMYCLKLYIEDLKTDEKNNDKREWWILGENEDFKKLYNETINNRNENYLKLIFGREKESFERIKNIK